MLEIEYEEPSSSACDCCGGVTTSLTRFVTKDGEAFAVVYLRFSDNHPRREVWGAVSAGRWWDGCGPADRDAFGLLLRSGPENFEVSVANAVDSPWAHIALIGEKLTREAALAHPLIQDVFHITAHLFREDQVLLSYLNAPAA